MTVRLFCLITCLSLIAKTYALSDKSLSADPVNLDKQYPPSIIELSFDSFGSELNGHLYQANGQGPHPTVVMLHGLPGNEKNLDLAQSIRRAGFNVLFFHYRGAWGSEGYYSFSNTIDDVASALNFLRSEKATKEYRVDANHLILLGHSMGGFSALQASARDESIQCTIGVAAANFGARVESEEALQGLANYTETASPLNVKKDTIADEIRNNKQTFDVHNLAPKLSGKSILLIAGASDTVLPPDIIHKPMVSAFKQNKDIKLTDKVISGDHAFSWSRFELSDNVIKWLKSNCL